MRCPLGRDELVLEVQLAPPAALQIEEEGLVSYHELAYVTPSLPPTDTAPPNSTALLLDTIVSVCPNRAAGISPHTFTFSPHNLRI